MYAFNARGIMEAQRKYRRAQARAQTKKKQKREKIQVTKIIVFSIMITYYIAFAVAVWVVIAKDIYQLSSLLTFTGSVAAFAVAFYCWKSKAENLEKIKKGNPDLCGSLSDFSGMGSQ
jgi:pheromone shutdown protein TraB